MANWRILLSLPIEEKNDYYILFVGLFFQLHINRICVYLLLQTNIDKELPSNLIHKDKKEGYVS